MNSERLFTDEGFVILTGKGDGGKSMLSNMDSYWIKSNDDGIILWRNEDDPTEIPTDPGFVIYENYI